MDLGLTGKAALVTAASRGIGKAVARELAAGRARGLICARGRGDLGRDGPEVRDLGGEVHAVQADAANVEDPPRVVEETVRLFGRIDILVNNAGDAWLGRSVDTTDDEWRYSMDVTFFSAVRFTRAVVPHMRR